MSKSTLLKLVIAFGGAFALMLVFHAPHASAAPRPTTHVTRYATVNHNYVVSNPIHISYPVHISRPVHTHIIVCRFIYGHRVCSRPGGIWNSGCYGYRHCGPTKGYPVPCGYGCPPMGGHPVSPPANPGGPCIGSNCGPQCTNLSNCGGKQCINVVVCIQPYARMHTANTYSNRTSGGAYGSTYATGNGYGMTTMSYNSRRP